MALINQVIALVEQLDDEEYSELRAFIVAHTAEREARPLLDLKEAEIITDLQESGQITRPEVAYAPAVDAPAWLDPKGERYRMYHQGDIVTHNGMVWESAHPGLNHWEPGGVGVYQNVWRDVTPPETVEDPETGETVEVVPDFVQPTGAHDAYQSGDRVTWQGAIYESAIDNNTWSPSDYPQGWKKEA